MKKFSSPHRNPPVALITGAAGGLGAHLARDLAQLGYAIALHHRSGASQSHRLAKQLRSFGCPVEVVRADLSRPAEVTRMVRKIRQRFTKIDLLINNAGTYRPTPLLQTRPEDWFAGLHSTATAVFLVTLAALPLFPQRGGQIINLGDSAADRLSARKLAPGYHVGKLGVTLLTRSFAAQLASRKITVNSISPGYLQNSIDLPPAAQLPAGRPVSFSEVSSAVHYLISPAAAQLSGSNLLLTGGWNL